MPRIWPGQIQMGNHVVLCIQKFHNNSQGNCVRAILSLEGQCRALNL